MEHERECNLTLSWPTGPAKAAELAKPVALDRGAGPRSGKAASGHAVELCVAAKLAAQVSS